MAGNDHIEDILLRVRGESRDAVEAIGDVRRELGKVPKSTQAEIEIQTAKAQAELDQVQASLSKIDRTKATATLDAEVGKAMAKIAAYRATLDKVTDRKDTTTRIDVQIDKATAQIAGLQAQIDHMEKQHPEVIVEARIADAQASLRQVQERLLRLNRQVSTPKVKADTNRALAQIDLIRARIAEMEAKDPRVTIDADIGKARAKLAEVQGRVDRLRNERVEIETRVDNDSIRTLAGIEGGLSTLAKGLRRASDEGQSFGQTLQRGFFLIKGLTPFIAGLSLIITTALIPALIAIGASALSAASGVGALATAIGGALIPAAIAGVAVMARFQAVMKVKQQLDAADAAAVRDSATAEQEHASAMEQARAKMESLADAIRNVTRARANLRTAEESASDAIVQANEQAIEANQRLAQSQADLKQATVDAYRAMQDAIEDVKDAQLALEDAQLGQQEAALNTKEAQLALREFRQELGLTARSLDDTFNKFTDVDADVSGIAGALRRAGKASGKLDAGSLLELQKLLLGVQKAKLGEKKADDALGDAETALTRARQEQQKFLKDGIKAYAPYRAAVEAVKDAQSAANKAADAARELEKAGIKQAPQVIAAHQAVADAIRARDRASRDLKGPEPLSGADQASAQAAAALAELSQSEQDFLTRLRGVQKFLTGQFQPATDQVFDGLRDAVTRGAATLPFLRDKIIKLGGTWGDVARQISGTVFSFSSVLDLRALADVADEISRLAGTGISKLYLLLIRVARAAGPETVDLLKDLVGQLGTLADNAGKLDGKEKFFKVAANSVRAFVDALEGVGELFIAVVETIGPFGDQIVGIFADAARSMAKWLKSAKGQKKIKAFFENVLPAVKEFIEFVGKLIQIFIEFGQFVGPIVTGVLKSINFFLDALLFLLRLFNAIVNNPVGRFLRELLGSFIGFGLVGKILRGIVFLFGRLGGLFRLIGPAATKAFGLLKGLIAGVAKGFGSLVGKVAGVARNLVTRFIGVITNAAPRLVAAGSWILRQIMAGLRAVFGPVVRFGARIGNAIWQGIKSVANTLFEAGKWIWGQVKKGLTTLLAIGGEIWNMGVGIVEKMGSGLLSAGATLFDVGVQLLGKLIDGFTTIGKAVFTAIKGLAEKIVRAVKHALGVKSPSTVMYEIGQFMLQGLLDGFTSKDVASFIKKNLGGIAGLAKDLALSISPLALPFKGINLLEDITGVDVPFLAKGGVVNSPTLAAIGEGAHREAVIPLSRSVLTSLGRAIARSMPSLTMPSLRGLQPQFAVATAGSGGGGVHVEKIVVESPAGSIPDARVAAVKLARELESRGGGPRQT